MCLCINKQTLETSCHKMYQFHSLIHPLNKNVPMHAPVNLSSPLVKWILPLGLPFLSAVWQPHSQFWVTVVKEKPRLFKVIHWAIRINSKVIWKFTATRSCYAVHKVYYILNIPIRILMVFLKKLFWVSTRFFIFNNTFNKFLEPLTTHIGWNCACASWW